MFVAHILLYGLVCIFSILLIFMGAVLQFSHPTYKNVVMTWGFFSISSITMSLAFVVQMECVNHPLALVIWPSNSLLVYWFNIYILFSWVVQDLIVYHQLASYGAMRQVMHFMIYNTDVGYSQCQIFRLHPRQPFMLDKLLCS